MITKNTETTSVETIGKKRKQFESLPFVSENYHIYSVFYRR
jgi:hypothetical protein